MKKKFVALNALVIIMIVIGGSLLVTAGIFAIKDNGTGSSGENRQKVVCDGTIDVPAIGSNYQIKEASCRLEPCGFLTFSLFGDSGKIKLYVDNQLRDQSDWTGDFFGSGDQQFKLSTACLSDPQSYEVTVENDAGQKTDSKTGDL